MSAATVPPIGRFGETLKRRNFLELPITLGQAEKAGSPIGEHRDPFDRLPIAQALRERIRLVSIDSRLDALGVDRIW